MDIPEDISNQAFVESNIGSGDVIKTLYEFADGSKREKYFIYVNSHRSRQTDPLFFVVTTSNMDFYLRNPEFNDDVVSISAQSLPFFRKDTVIDCRQVYDFSFENLKKRFRSGELEFSGTIPDEIMERIYEVIRKSRFISKVHKKFILGDEG